jgi:hypothetical protein
VRAKSAKLVDDRPLAEEIAAVSAVVETGAFAKLLA